MLRSQSHPLPLRMVAWTCLAFSFVVWIVFTPRCGPMQQQPTHRAVEASVVAVAPPAEFLVIVLSAERPGGVDYATSLVRQLAGVDARVVVWGREQMFASDPDYSTLDADPARDKHHDPVERIRWRARASLDYASVFEYVSRQAETYVVMLEDDVTLGREWMKRVRDMAHTDVVWWAWALFHAEEFDQGRVYGHGDVYQYEACQQAMMYRVSQLAPLAAFFRQRWRVDPNDWILRDYFRDRGSVVRVAVPSVVQHVGRVSTFGEKKAISGCTARNWIGE